MWREKGAQRLYKSRLQEKFSEALQALLPIICIVLLLAFVLVPVPTSILMAFLFGGVLLVVGMMFFTLGADLAMAPMGERMGVQITKSRKLPIVLAMGFLLGFLITVSD